MSEENNYKTHFNKELKILKRGVREGDELTIEPFITIINEILDIHSQQGHSGCSAHCSANYLSNVVRSAMLFKPLSPLTGDDSEWVDVDDSYQNNRDGAVFKDKKTNKSSYLDAIAWSGEDKYDIFTGMVEGVRSRQNIKFPFSPKTFHIDVKKVYIDKDHRDECDYIDDGNGNYYTYEIKDKTQLEEVAKYYDMQNE